MANYAIMRIEKRKLPSVGRINKHHERQKEEYKSNPDIDWERTGLNYHIIAPSLSYRDAVLARIEQAEARRRKDSVVLQDCFVGGTPDWLKAKSQEEQREYFDHAYQFFENNFGKENIISAVVHMDEAMVNALIEKITVGERVQKEDGTVEQTIKIYYKFVGVLSNELHIKVTKRYAAPSPPGGANAAGRSSYPVQRRRSIVSLAPRRYTPSRVRKAHGADVPPPAKRHSR